MAEFFAGVGLVRAALEAEGCRVVFANDVDERKGELYAANFAPQELVLGDIRAVSATSVPSVEIATASFPCTDLSLAGNRAGLEGRSSSVFWEFVRILTEMKERAPRAVLLENVVGFATSRNGADLAAAIESLNLLGYTCDLFTIDARRFVPQSRPRLFVVGSLVALNGQSDWGPSDARPAWVGRFVAEHPTLRMHALPMALPQPTTLSLTTVAECLPSEDVRWWDRERAAKFQNSLSPLQARRLEQLRSAFWLSHAAAYRRTRNGRAVWEIRDDSISGCLRTTRGGSSRQAIVEAGQGELRVRWMTPLEYARLQGAPDFKLKGFPNNQILFAMGDAVCVPVVRWIARNYLVPLVSGRLSGSASERTGTRDG